jgi:hypothetical protein
LSERERTGRSGLLRVNPRNDGFAVFSDSLIKIKISVIAGLHYTRNDRYFLLLIFYFLFYSSVSRIGFSKGVTAFGSCAGIAGSVSMISFLILESEEDDEAV